MPKPTTLAALQFCSTPDRAANLSRLLALINAAADAGATFVATPENSDAIAPREERLAASESLAGPFITTLRGCAAKRRIHLLIGSFGERIEGQSKVHNTSVLIAPDGAFAAVYRKIHLFDANPSDGVAYRESESVVPGEATVTADVDGWRLGMSICYDLRFPELYRRHASDGASLLSVPAAFTVPTGEAHWHVLLRARAIENLAYVVAPAQVGTHFPGRRSYGHALIVSPWGEVLADAGGDGEGLALAKLEPLEIKRLRDMVPALSHRRL
jgi:predicted amidohydrolase